MTQSKLSPEERKTEAIEIKQGIPQIPIDLFVNKNRKSVQFSDAFHNLIYKVADASSISHGRILLDASGNPLISIFRSQDGTWKGFKGDGCGELVFKIEQTLNTFNKIEFNIFVTGENGADLTFALRGCCFWRTCTIYQDKYIVAQTNLMYKLGFRKHFVGRSKFRLTIFPGYSDYALIASLILVFMEGRKHRHFLDHAHNS
ncbi:unnamed protein product [Amaranthus hypochondriacus]